MGFGKKSALILSFVTFSFLSLYSGFANPVVSAQVDAATFAIGDTVTVKVALKQNTGLHGVYFDLGFNPAVLAFSGLDQGDLVQNLNQGGTYKSSLLYAVSDPATSALKGAHVVSSLSMNTSDDVFSGNGVIANIYFRVIAAVPNNGGFSFNFIADGSGAYGPNKMPYAGITFENSSVLTTPAATGKYVQITSPLSSDVIYTDTVKLGAISSTGAGYTYTVSNPVAGFLAENVSAISGSLSAYSVPVLFGLNRITVDLKDQYKTKLASSTILLYRSQAETFVKIISPVSHALVNTDMVTFLVSSPLAAVQVNGLDATLLGEKHEGKNLFSARLWLKKGFNTITAKAIGPQGERFTHSIQVYYQKDDNLFKLSSPEAGTVIKADVNDRHLVNGSLKIRGEIGSAFKDPSNPNAVSLDLLFRPKNPILPVVKLVQNRQLIISEATSTGMGTQAPYQFENEFVIPVDGLESGELEVTVYKNRSGSSNEGELHRILYVDNGVLSINLVQPNVHGLDILDTKEKIQVFNNAVMPSWNSTMLGSNGELGLKADQRVLRNNVELNDKSVVSLIQAKDGTQYALVNQSNKMKLYTKPPFATAWGEPVTFNDLFGYSLCATDVGLLIGVSNLYSSNNSGLYVYQNGSLKNVSIGEPIPHVQFIENQEGTIYLYGNGYSHLYSFNVYALQESNGRYQATAVKKTPFANDQFISQFVLGPNARTAFLVSKEKKLSVFQNISGNGLFQVSNNELGISEQLKVASVVFGAHRNGSYNTYALVTHSDVGEVDVQSVMERTDSGRLVYVGSVHGLEAQESNLMGLTFSNDRFTLLHKRNALVGNGYEYVITRASILFNKATIESDEFDVDELVFPSANDIKTANPQAFPTYSLLMHSRDAFSFGFKNSLQSLSIYTLSSEYPSQGQIAFDYKNPDAEALHGFSFKIDPSWLPLQNSAPSTDIELAFGLFDRSSGTTLLSSEGFSTQSPSYITLSKLLYGNDPRFSTNHAYDPGTQKEIISVVFNQDYRNSYLSFAFRFKPVGMYGRYIADLSISKKVPIKIPRSPGEIILLPLQGWISDPTVSEIKIQEITVPVEQNGYFSYQYPIQTAHDTSRINLSCRNSSGELATLALEIQLFDSHNSLTNVQLKDGAGLPLQPIEASDPEQLETTNDSVFVSGKFFGLEGLMVGYELYAFLYTDGVQRLEKLDGKIFTTTRDAQLDPAIAAQYGTGYVSGVFTDQKIQMYPGNQRLVVYVENPGGKRTEYTIDSKPVDISYNLPVNEQEILLTNEGIEPLLPVRNLSNVVVDQQLAVVLNEVYDTEARAYTFKRTVTVSGRVNSLYRFTDLKVRSLDSAMKFSNGLAELIIPVDELNRFTVECQIELGESIDEIDLPLLFIPTAPFLDWMKTGVLLKASKDYEGSFVVPDFSPMQAANWNASEKIAFKKALRVKVPQHIPGGTMLNLIVNYETSISGFLDVVDPSNRIYKLLDAKGNEVLLTGLKEGQNRLRWELSNKGSTISSSASGNKDMHDELLTLTFSDSYTPTTISFALDAIKYYDDNTNDTDGGLALPKATISKHTSTYVEMFLNGQSVLIDESKSALVFDLAAFKTRLLQGKNTVQFFYKEKSGNSAFQNYTCLYDTAKPAVAIQSWQYSTDASPHLVRLNAIVVEANLRSIELRQTKSGVTSVITTPYILKPLGDNTFEVVWEKLGELIPLLKPDVDNPLFVYVSDYTDRYEESARFTGQGANPPSADYFPVIVPIGGSSYNSGLQPFMLEDSRWGNAPFNSRVKIYNSRVELKDLPGVSETSNATVNRIGDIRMVNTAKPAVGQTLTLSSNSSVTLGPGVSIPLGSSLVIPKPQTESNVVPPMLAFTHGADSSKLGFGFWFRYEEDPWYSNDDLVNYKKVLSLSRQEFPNKPENGQTLIRELMVAYKDTSASAYGDERLYLVERRFVTSAAGIIADKTIPLLGTDTPFTLNHGGKNGWNLVALGTELTLADNEYKLVFTLSVNQQKPVSFDYLGTYESRETDWANGPNSTDLSVDSGAPTMEFILARLLGAGATHVFGNTNGLTGTQDETVNNGCFSIGQPFYINRPITTDDIRSMKTQLDAAFAAESTSFYVNGEDKGFYYPFNDNTNDYTGNAYLQLSMQGEKSDYLSKIENADYSENVTSPAGPGSLRASNGVVNRLKLKEGKLMFRDSTSAVVDHLTATPDGAWLQLKPTSPASYPGKYAFGNTFGSHTLMTQNCYSISGVVEAENPVDNDTFNVRLVLSINGKEQSFPLQPGPFHVLYQNPANVIPTNVVMYIETRTEIRLSQTMFLTEGNYRLPAEAFNGLASSSARMVFPYGNTGTIDFWYKPMISNSDGFVDYPVTLFDSEFVKIYSTPSEKVGHNVFAFQVNSNLSNGTSEHKSEFPLSNGWHHVQLSWDLDASIIYLYVDGAMVAKREQEFTGSPFMLGNVSSGFNTFIGTNSAGTQFAKGWIDEFRISRLFQRPLFVQRDPIAISYSDNFSNNQANPQLSIINTNAGLHSITGLKVILWDIDKKILFQKENVQLDAIGLDIKQYPAGSYKLELQALVNGFRYDKTFKFTKNDRPRFVLQSYPSLIVKDVPATLKFKFAYDNSYLLAKDLEPYAGIKLRVWNESDATFNQSYYIVQDFRSFNHNDGWLLYRPDSNNVPVEYQVNSNMVDFDIPNVTANSKLNWEYKPFYFANNFSTDADPSAALTSLGDGLIPIAELNVQNITTTIKSKDYQYKLLVSLGTSGISLIESADDFAIQYSIESSNNQILRTSDRIEFSNTGEIELFYDDVLKDLGEGTFVGKISLYYRNVFISHKSVELNYQYKLFFDEVTLVAEKRLVLTEFSLLQVTKNSVNTPATAQLFVAYEQNGFTQDGASNQTSTLKYKLFELVAGTKGVYSEILRADGVLETSLPYLVLSGVTLGASDSLFRINIFEETPQGIGLSRSMDLVVTTRANPPEVVLTNTVASRIAYNNVRFSWIGYHESQFKSDIAYSYNFDDKGWSAVSPEWRSVEYFSLTEGYHRFSVRAHYGENNVSPIESATFYVDVNRPAFNNAKISVNKLYDSYGFLYAVNLVGAEGAVVDSSLSGLALNGELLNFNPNGSFASKNIPITVDGDNLLTLTAYDSVGNFTNHQLIVSNPVTEIIYPQTGKATRYTPMTVVGRIAGKINESMEIYLRDPLTVSTGTGNYANWHKATINADFTFFVENVTVTPGSYAREVHTTLEMAIVSKSGRVYTKFIDVFANEVTRPINLKLSTHAVEGERAETTVTISADAQVEGISSWSIDYTGDGMYDEVTMVDNPALAKSISWTHVYSSLGIVKPRVRLITKSGEYFAVYDELIIHEKIREASNKSIETPIAVSSITMEDYSQRLFVLAGKNGTYRVEVYEISRNDAFVSNKLYQVELAGLGIGLPVKIVALDDKTLLIADNAQGNGVVHTLRADEFDSFSLVASSKLELPGTVADIHANKNKVYVSLQQGNTLVTADLVAGLPHAGSIVSHETASLNDQSISSNSGLSKDAKGLLLADYFNQRIVRLSDNFANLEYLGSHGTGEGEFIKPALVRSYQNRIFIWDEGRKDIQVVDPEFKPISTLRYDVSLGNDNYLQSGFLDDVAGVEAFAREESNRLFYYVVLLSKSTGKLSVLRMPQWEEMRAKTRNNAIIFLNDREVYSAKPNGADLTRLISTDSIPRISGSVDYPVLSPDGKRLAFTSRATLYDGSGQVSSLTNYAYDNLYVMNTNGSDLTRIPMSALSGYEIERPQFNSNGTQLVFSAKPTGSNWQLYTYSFDTGSIQRVFTSDENARYPYYSPDDRFIAFSTDYDGDQDIQIFDTLNPSMRVSVTSNQSRDAYPVWSVVYPGEIANSDLMIESKIAFVSDRDYHKGVYYVYIARPSEADIRIVTKTGNNIGNEPDTAAIELTTSTSEGDYPSFTGDGTAVVYEYFDGIKQTLVRYDFETKNNSALNVPGNVKRPAGMKNTIAQFTSEVSNGNEVVLNWSRYTDTDVFYTVRFKANRPGEQFVEKRVFTQDHTRLTGLEMGVEYLFQVSIEENGVAAAASLWKKVLIPEVVARPSYTIDPNNPYLVHLKAWKPKADSDWGFSWIIDNQEIQVQSSQDYLYEFSTSGTKTIILKAHNKANTYTHISAPMTAVIVSDIQPVLEYVLAEDDSYIELSALKSLGNRIDWASTTWTITGPGSSAPQMITGSKAIVNTSAFKHKINVNLKLTRTHVNGQGGTDTIESNTVVDLDYSGTKLVVTQSSDERNDRLITFSGTNSIGNINWREARWTIYRDGQVLFQTNGLSSFAYEFPETGIEARYSVSLSVPRISDGETATVTNIVSIAATPIEPVIDYEVIDLKNAQGVVQGAKIVFSAGNSKGNNIDFAQAKWTLPVAGSYGEQPTQMGPTAVYNLFNIGSTSQVEVSLTLMRRGSTEAKTINQVIFVKSNEYAKPELKVNSKSYDTNIGKTFEFDVLSSTGPNIDWERTEWQFSNSSALIGQNLNQRGPTARLDLPSNAEETVLRYSVTLYLTGSHQPIVKKQELRLKASTIKPVIALERVKGGDGKVFNLSVTDSSATNIDWERTTWLLYDGHETVTQKFGAQITHAFLKKNDAMGYPVVVTMFFKNNAVPFYGYTSVDIEGDALVPAISWDKADASTGSEIVFTAEQSLGAGIDWSQSKWTFGDGSPSQYGPSVSHRYEASSKNASYKVSLTLTRRLGSGELETATQFTTVTIGKDEVTPIIRARLLSDGNLVLSASESEGRGLLLERSIWVFPDVADNETITKNRQTGKSMSQSWNLEARAWVGAQTPSTSVVNAGILAQVTGNIGGSHSDTRNDAISSTYTNTNFHTGITARRWIGNFGVSDSVDHFNPSASNGNGKSTIRVQLSIFRVEKDNSVVGETITVDVNISAARSSAGAVYR